MAKTDYKGQEKGTVMKLLESLKCKRMVTQTNVLAVEVSSQILCICGVW